MKKPTLILTLLFSTVMFSSPSYAKWTKVTENAIGDTFYVDYERIRKHDGYVYFWSLRDALKPSEDGVLSGKIYRQGDCKLFRNKVLSVSFHKEPMGMGIADVKEIPKKFRGWEYPPSDSVIEVILKSVCSR